MPGRIGLGTLRTRLGAFAVAVALLATLLLAAAPARDADAKVSFSRYKNTGNVQNCKSVVIVGKKKVTKNCAKRDQRARSDDIRLVFRNR